MLARTGVSHGYCSDAKRTHQTLAPLKQVLGNALAITEFSAADPAGPDGHVEAVVAAIAALPADAVAVAVSHSNTVGPIIKKLGGGTIAAIGDSEFDKLFLLIAAHGGKSLVELRY
jgi:phosphohistidine phosphatase SixA